MKESTFRARSMAISKAGNPIDVRLSRQGVTPQADTLHAVCQSVAEAADTPYSYVMVTTKAIPELIKTSKILAPLLTKEYTDKFEQPTYVLVQNGLNVEVDLYNAIKALGRGDPSVISTALWIGTNLLGPNVVEHNNFVSRHTCFQKGRV